MNCKPAMTNVAPVLSQLGIDIEREIGEGSFKVVYLGNVNNKREAIKLVIIPVNDQDPSIEESNRHRLKREIALLKECQTPYLVKLGSVDPLDCEIENRKFVCYSEEYIDGVSLRSHFGRGKPSQSELAQLAKCLFMAVQELAQKNAIHRDIKPDNIYLSRDANRPFILLDLGLAFIIGGSHLTQNSNEIMGTQWYLAPEMFLPNFRDALSYRADLYTIGVTLYEFATGEHPFGRRNDPLQTTIFRILQETPPKLSLARTDLDPGFGDIVDQLIKKRPALRPSNLAQLISQMEVFL